MQDVVFDSLDVFHCTQCREPIKADVLEPFSSVACPLCQAHNTVPAKFGAFLLQERIGDGIMSVVFQALDPQLDRKISIKILNYVLSKNQELVEAFKREALAAAALSAHNVLKVYEFGIHNGQPFMVMEAIQGVYLNELLRRESLDASEILHILQGVARGLHETHEAGIVHGEVMPRNILLDAQNTPKLCEFGLARFAHESDSNQPSWSSPYYMPPERILGEPEDHRGDIYSLGTTLYYMLTGHLPFFDMDDEVVRSRKVNEAPPEVLAVQPAADPDLAALTAQMLAANPDDRIASWEDLLYEIGRIAPAVHKRTPLGTEGDGSASTLSRPPRKPFPWLVALILLLAIAAGIGIFFLDRNERAIHQAKPTQPPLPTVHRSYSEDVRFRPSPEALPPLEEAPPAEATHLLLHLRASAPNNDPQDSRQAVWKDSSGQQRDFLQKSEALRPEWFASAMNERGALLFDKKLMVSTLQASRLDQFSLVVVAQDLGSLDNAGGPEHILLGVDPAATGHPRLLVYLDKRKPGYLFFETNEGSASLPLPGKKDETAFVACLTVRADLPDLASLNGQVVPLDKDLPKRDRHNPAALPYLQLGGLLGQETFFSGFISELILLPQSLRLDELASLSHETLATAIPAP